MVVISRLHVLITYFIYMMMVKIKDHKTELGFPLNLFILTVVTKTSFHLGSN